MGAIKDIFDLIMELIRGDISDRKSFFENHVEPIHNKFRQIHKDYISGFKEVRDKLEEQAVPRDELISFLRDRRREYEDERQFTMDLASELAKPEQARFTGDLRSAIDDFCHAILGYFAVSGGIAYCSWFTGFIKTVEIKAKFEGNGVSP